jgi:hypothetical protein
MQRHEIPTHLNVEDRALFGLTLRQVMHLLAGLAAAYALWTHLAERPEIPAPVRLTAAALCFVAFAAITLLRPYGRSLGDWLLAVAAFSVASRRSIWLRSPAAPLDAPPVPNADVAWQEFAPRLSWPSLPERPVKGAMHRVVEWGEAKR